MRLGWVLVALVIFAGEARADDLVIGSKNFEENRLLCEMFARVIETRTDLTVERRFNLAGSTLCFEAVESGEIDLYPEYTGTALFNFLGETHSGSAREALYRVRLGLKQRFDLDWIAPLGFENAYALAVPRALAEKHALRTITDLARVAPTLRAGFGFEFVERPDALPALRETYGLRFADVSSMQQNLKLQAVASGDIDCLADHDRRASEKTTAACSHRTRPRRS